jgi:cold shock CspA family protein
VVERHLGIVKKFIPERGFGFVQVLKEKPDGGPAMLDRDFSDIFIHKNELRRSGIDAVERGDLLSFNIEQLEKGPMATNIGRAQ